MTNSRPQSPTAAEEQQEHASVRSNSRAESPIAAGEPLENPALEADDGSDGDSALSIPAPSLSSLRSSVLEHQIENGRTYHSMSSGTYAYPNDDIEVERLEIQHNLWLLTLQGALASCPKAEDAKRVLDIGTASGIWAIEYADANPEAEVIGVDLSPIQPSLVPPNCSFEVDDLEKEWTWTKPFDFIMSRAMSGSFSNYETYIKKAYDALEPGGYLELEDIALPYSSDDGTLTEDTATYRCGQLAYEAGLALGRPLHMPRMYKDLMIKAGFTDIVEQQYKWPIGVWPKDKYYKEIGYWTFANLDHGVEGLMMALLTRGKGWTREEVLIFCSQARACLRDTSVHAYIPIYVVYGKKPGTATA